MKSYECFGALRSGSRTKKIVFIAIILLLALIPTYFAISSYVEMSERQLSPNTLQVSLYYKDELLYEKSDDPENTEAERLVVIFDSLINNLTPAYRIPEDAFSPPPIKVVMTTLRGSSEYLCYFNLDGLVSYCVDSEEVFFIDQNDTYAFLSSVYSHSLYKNATPPPLFTSFDEAVEPYYAQIEYKNIDDVYFPAESPALSQDDGRIFTMAGALGISFDTPPDKCSVTVKKGEDIIFKGDYAAMSTIASDVGTLLHFDVEAEWEKKDRNDFYGKTAYKFSAVIKDSASFALDKTETVTGSFLLLSCSNATDISKIGFSASPAINAEPVFFADNDIVRALIPFDHSLAEGKYTITLSYGAARKSFEVTLKKNTSLSIQIDDEKREEFLKYITPDATAEIEDIYRTLRGYSEKNIFFRNAFLDMGDTSSNFGDTYVTSIGESINSMGVLFEQSGASSAVKALNSGKVFKVGYCTYLGNYLILDHGLGLRTLYAHLSAVTAKEGDVLSSGQLLGLCGSLTYGGDVGVYIMCFVYDTPIDYKTIAGKSLDFYTSDKTS